MENDSNNPVLFLVYSRSGGTLFNRCLAVMPRVVMLSEVNKLGGGWGVLKENSYTTIQTQAKNWYNIDIVNTEFDEALIEFISKVKDQNCIPVIRDWCHVNFNPSQHNNFNPPNQLLTVEALKNQSDLKIVLLVRDAVDVYISSKPKSTETFFSNYRKYIDAVTSLNAKIIKYEEFCLQPHKVMQDVCEYTGIPFDSSFTEKYLSFEKVNGDVQLQGVSRNLNENKISLGLRKVLDKSKVKELESNADFKYCNEKFGYKPTYFNLERGTSGWNYFKRRWLKWQ